MLLSAPDGETCLSLAQHCSPDLFILDISMPQMDGWALAEALQAAGHRKANILMLSASALEAHGRSLAQQLHDGYLMKPLDIPRLLGEIGRLLKLEWKHGASEAEPPPPSLAGVTYPPRRHIDQLIRLGEMGHVRALQSTLADIEREHPECAAFAEQARTLVDAFNLGEFLARLRLQHHDE